MRISTRLTLAGGAPLLMALVASLALGLSQREVRREQQRARSVARVIHSLNELSSLVGVYLLYHEERPRQQFLAEHAAATQTLASVRFCNREQQQLLDALRGGIDAMKETFLRTVAVHERLPASPDARALGHDEERLAGQLLVRARQAVTDGLRLEALVRDGIEATQRTVSLLVFLLILAVALPLTLALLRLLRTTQRDLATLHRGTVAVGSGDLAHRVGLTGEDELAELARAFDQMTSRLQAVTVSRNDLEREVGERQRAEEALQTIAAELQVANASLHESRAEALSLMQDAVEARRQAEQASADLARNVAELQATNQELERFNRAAVGRELRMVELKREVNQVCRQAGLAVRYALESEKPSG